MTLALRGRRGGFIQTGEITMPQSPIEIFLRSAEDRIDRAPDSLPFDAKMGRLVVGWLRARLTQKQQVQDILEGGQ